MQKAHGRHESNPESGMLPFPGQPLHGGDLSYNLHGVKLEQACPAINPNPAGLSGWNRING
jgi:hypothetical protein